MTFTYSQKRWLSPLVFCARTLVGVQAVAEDNESGSDGVIEYRREGTGGHTDVTHWWVTCSNAGFMAVLVVVLGGGYWLYRHVQAGDAEAAAILYPFAVFVTAAISLTCWVGTLTVTLLSKGGRRIGKALVPWSFALLACGAVVVVYWVEALLRR